MTSRNSPKVGSRAQNPSKSPKNDQRSVFPVKNAQKSQKPKKDNSSSETALFDKESNWSLEVRHLSPRKGSKYGVALVCDWLTTPGGAEKVLLELHRMYPDAPIYTSQYSKKGIDWFADADVRTGWLQIFPRAFRKFIGPLRQLYFSHLDLSSYDLVISVTGAEAKSVRTKPRQQSSSKSSKTDLTVPKKHPSSKNAPSIEPQTGATHLCYCHVPTQYYWQMYDKYVANPGFGLLNPLVRLAFRVLVKPLRQADYRAAQQPDQFITISNYAKDQIQKYYQRDAVVIAPPVEVAKFTRSSVCSLPENSKNHRRNSTFPPEVAQKSTASGELSTKSPKISTNSPQEIHCTPHTFPSRSSTSPQIIHSQNVVYPQGITTSPQHFHQKSTENRNFSTTSPQNIADLSTVSTKISTTFPQVFHNQSQSYPQDGYFIISCRQVNWKRVDLAITACKSLHLPLKVIGSGPEHSRLVKLADNCPNIEFIPWLDTGELAHFLQNATAYLFPSLEPFGIAAVEALAAGCPVIAYREGGSQDFIEEGKNGLFFDQQTPDSLIKALHTFYDYDFDPNIVAQTAQRFSPDHFRQQIQSLINQSFHGIVKSDLDPSQSHPSSSTSSHSKPITQAKQGHSNPKASNSSSRPKSITKSKPQPKDLISDHRANKKSTKKGTNL